MSFQEDCVRFGDELARLVDAGIPVKEAAIVVGVPRQRCYAILRAIGRPVGKPRGKGVTADHALIVDYNDGSVYKQPMTSVTCDDTARPAISDRYLSIGDRVVIADGLAVKDSLRTIASRIGKNVSTLSREVRAHSIDGRYFPYQADRTAAAARARSKQISHRLRLDHPDDESMRVSHETIYQACISRLMVDRKLK